jgi:hypothetical protein
MVSFYLTNDLLDLGKLGFDISYFTDVQDLNYLIKSMETREGESTRFTKLNQAIADVVQDYALVTFLTLNIQDKKSVHNVLKYIDKSNGYVFGACEKDNASIIDIASGDIEWDHDRYDDARQYMHNDEEEEYDE